MLTFMELCAETKLSPNTARKRLGELGIEPVRVVGAAKLYTRAQARSVLARHETHGGRWPKVVR